MKVIKKDNWVGVVAKSFPEALAAKNKIKVEWNIPKKWTQEEIIDLLKVGNGDEMITQKAGSAVDPNDENVVALEFSSPLGAHAQIEPLVDMLVQM